MAEEGAYRPNSSSSGNNNNNIGGGSTLLVGVVDNVANTAIWVIRLPRDVVKNYTAYVRTYLGDGVMRVKAGEVLQRTPEASSQGWHEWEIQGLRYDFSSTDDQRPDHPPELVPGKRWFFVGLNDKIFYKSDPATRDVGLGTDNLVFVLREGLAMPTRTLVGLVNTAHAVLVLRGSTEYFYLHKGLVMSADEEESLMEWGVGRALLGNSVIAMGGALLVAFAAEVWQQALVGTFLVAAASYRVQGVLTKVLRVWSNEWKRHDLIPSGSLGMERAVQFTIVALVALAGLLEDRVVLLTVLTFASVHVVFLESLGQAVTTWGWRTYSAQVFHIVGVWTGICLACAGFSWLTYVFAGAFSCLLFGSTTLVLWVCAVRKFSDLNRTWEKIFWSFILVTIEVVGWVAYMDWGEAGMKWSTQSLQPWKWSLTRAPDSFLSLVRLPGLWFVVVVPWPVIALVIPQSLFFCIAFDTTKPRGERTRARQRRGVFCHFHESSIPSRNLLLPPVDS